MPTLPYLHRQCSRGRDATTTKISCVARVFSTPRLLKCVRTNWIGGGASPPRHTIGSGRWHAPVPGGAPNRGGSCTGGHPPHSEIPHYTSSVLAPPSFSLPLCLGTAVAVKRLSLRHRPPLVEVASRRPGLTAGLRYPVAGLPPQRNQLPSPPHARFPAPHPHGAT